MADRLSFRRLCGLGLDDTPNETTLGHFRAALVGCDLAEDLPRWGARRLFTPQPFTPGWADTGKLVAGQRLGRTVYIRGAL